MSRSRNADRGTSDTHEIPFFGAVLRVLRVLGFHRAMVTMFVLGVTSITLNVLGPLLLGRATDLIFAGVLGRKFTSVDDASTVEEFIRSGHEDLARVVSASGFRPGQGVDFGAVGSILVLTLVVYGISGLCWILQGRQATKVVQISAYRLRAEVAAKLSRLPLAGLEGKQRGDVLSRATNDIDNVVQTLQQTLSQLTNSGLLIIALLATMFWISPLLAVIALVVVPVAIALTTTVGKRAQPHFDRQWKTTGELNAYVEEMYSGHAVVRAFDQSDRIVRVFQTSNDRVRRYAYRAQLLSGAIQPLMNFINNIGYVLVAVIGCLRVLSGSISLGDLQAFIIYSRQLSGPLTQITNLVSVVQSGVASARRVFDLLDADEEEDDGETGGTARACGLVRFESVHFSYRADTPLIEDLSLTVEPGRTVAIVGATGAGKTTLVNLLMRFYDLSGGRITLDGRDISMIPRGELRSAVGLVLQDAWLFSGTVAENIAYGREGATKEQIEAAAAAAHVDHLIRTLPNGYDTYIDDESAGLSAGERQLITIARAFVADPVVLALDEATSSVDTRTEVLVRQAMERLSKGRTTFVIAHRLSTIRDADLILVMEQGAVVERGTHDELLALGGRYKAIYQAQFSDDVDPVR